MPSEATRECEIASCWWTCQMSQTIAPPLTEDQLQKFQSALQTVLEQRYENHWYTIDPERGSAFRSVLNEGRSMDQSLIMAARMANIPNLKGRLTVQCILWVDPGSIKVAYPHSKFPSTIWQRGEGAIGSEQFYWRPQSTSPNFLKNKTTTSKEGSSSPSNSNVLAIETAV
eukprot:TRINITY_DN393_c0_g1_i1.p1 TRINITY_DN393_c0_g1~~TRINITY_DN393_c0_g1_i1.p1  ORF type:complete len:171 (-),score=41.08 TRINITY_DN393_c0_g1_i1:199-711(-)